MGRQKSTPVLLKQNMKTFSKIKPGRLFIVFIIASFILLPLICFAQTPAPKQQMDAPKINIPIPGMPSLATYEFTPGETVSIPWIAEYMVAIYKYSITLGSIFAVVILMIGGILYLTAGGIPANVKKANTMIFGAITGLAVLMCAHLVLSIINPNLVKLSGLNTETVKQVEDFSEEPPASMTAPLGAGNEIEDLIGPNTLPPCSKKAAQDAAQKLHDLNICMGPCHCAYTATKFLKYIGCDLPYNGSAQQSGKNAENKGWITEVVTSANKNNLPVGLLWKFGHVGVSLGDGMEFQSGAEGYSRFKGCQKKVDDAMADPNGCNFCSLIIGEGPASGHFKSDGCGYNQAWTKLAIGPTWGVVFYPSPTETPAPQGCCTATAKNATTGKTDKLKETITEDWCSVFTANRDQYKNMTTKGGASGSTWTPGKCGKLYIPCVPVCASWEICDEGSCYPKTGACNNDGDCLVDPAKSTCDVINHKCYDPAGQSLTCTPACQAWETCQSGKCELTPGSCEDDDDCINAPIGPICDLMQHVCMP